MVPTITSQEIVTALVLFAVLSLPGWGFLAVTELWRNWDGLQRWCVAIGVSIVFYPLLFYWARAVIPGLQLGSRKLIGLLLFFLVLIIWKMWRGGRLLLPQQEINWVVLGVFAATIFTRFWIAHVQPYPAWSDSLHHTLLTQLTAETGQLPYTLEPYEPVLLNMYHLGLYAISGSVQMIAKIPAYMAILWTSQALNAFCVLGVFFVLDLKVSRQAALIGCVVVGLLSMQPAWYVNWGRYTQVASQAVLLLAWVINWEAIRAWSQPGKRSMGYIWGMTLAGAILSGGMFILHFRVAGFYLPLLMIVSVWELIRASQSKTFSRAVFGISIIGALSIFVITPVVVSALDAYIQNRLVVAESGTKLTDMGYYQFPLSTHFILAFQPWLFWIGFASALIGISRKNNMVLVSLLWVALLWLEGNAFRFNIPLISFTNYGAVMIMYYLPLSLIIGAGVYELLRALPYSYKGYVNSIGLFVLLMAGFVGSFLRVEAIEPIRYFMSSADETAMQWINSNVPSDGVFAINTLYWANSSVHGVDGGYWIPYFTGRKTTTGTMLYPIGEKAHRQEVAARSEAVSRISFDQANSASAVSDLCAMGVDYVYLGAHQAAFPLHMHSDTLDFLSGTKKLYDHEGVRIYSICNP